MAAQDPVGFNPPPPWSVLATGLAIMLVAVFIPDSRSALFLLLIGGAGAGVGIVAAGVQLADDRRSFLASRNDKTPPPPR